MGAPCDEPVTRSSERRGPVSARVWPRGGEQRVVDERAGDGADLRADGGAGERGAEEGDAGGQQRAAGGRAGNGESEGGHGGVGWGGGGVCGPFSPWGEGARRADEGAFKSPLTNSAK